MMTSVLDIKRDIEETGAIDRQTATKLNELVSGALFNKCHMNSFTEQPSDANLDLVMKVIDKHKEDTSLKLDATSVTDIVNKLKRNRKSIEESIAARIDVALMMRILKTDSIRIADKIFRDLTMIEVVENHEEISEFFHREISITKLRATAEVYRKADSTTVGRMIDRKNLINFSSMIDSVISELSTRIEKDIEVIIDPYSKLYDNLRDCREKSIPAFAEYCVSLIESETYLGS